MKKQRFTEEQIIAVLKEQEAGAKAADLCRRHGISEATFYNWKAKYGGEPGETVSSAARRHGVAPNLLYRWRRLLSEGGAAAVDSDEPVVGNSEVKKLEDRVRELERMLGRKTMEVEILREALSKADSKKRIPRPILLPKDGSR